MKKVWTFIIGKSLQEAELNRLLEKGKEFISNWTAHENKLDARFEVFKNRIVVVKVNEASYNASGCSIDKLTRFIKSCETEFNIELLNRLLVAYKNQDAIEVVNSSKIKELITDGTLNENTVVYNTSILNEIEFNNWEQELRDTWLKKYLHTA